MIHGAGFVSAVYHAISTLRISRFGAVILPLRGVQQFLERVHVAVLQQIAGLLPPEDVVRRHAPRRALVLLLAHQKFEEKGRLIELPALLAIGEDGAE